VHCTHLKFSRGASVLIPCSSLMGPADLESQANTPSHLHRAEPSRILQPQVGSERNRRSPPPACRTSRRRPPRVRDPPTRHPRRTSHRHPRQPHVAMVTAILAPHTHPHIARPLSAAVIHASRPPRQPRNSGQNSEANLRLQAKPSINPAAPSGRLDHLRASSPIHRSRCSSKKSIFNWMNRGRGRRRD